MILSLFQPLLSAHHHDSNIIVHVLEALQHTIYQLILSLRNVSSTKVVVYEARSWHSPKLGVSLGTGL